MAARESGRSLIAGMVVITGSLIPTVPPIAGAQRAVFTVDGLGDVVMDVA
jgi:2-keto-4-pentenoate hydratase